jgi:hypothetical protein
VLHVEVDAVEIKSAGGADEGGQVILPARNWFW